MNTALRRARQPGPSAALPAGGVPLHASAPVDEASGALSVGVPTYNTVARIVGDNREELPPGEVGEIVIAGPQVVPGYWNKPQETANALPGGALQILDDIPKTATGKRLRRELRERPVTG